MRYLSKSKDYLVNIAASLILAISTQLLAYPLLSRHMPEADYGLALSLMGVYNLIGVSLGNPLANTRILLEGSDGQVCRSGDFKALFVVSTVLSFVLCFALTEVFWGQFNCIFCVSGGLLGSLIIGRCYLTSQFRVELSFEKLLVTNCFGLVGYLVGLGVFVWLYSYWPIVFIFGETGSFIALVSYCSFLKEPFRITRYFNTVLRKYVYLFVASFLITFMTYADRFILTPLLGLEAVSVYVIASFVGKSVGLFVNPISSVSLSYAAKETRTSSRALIRMFVLYFAGFALFTIVIVALQKPLTFFLYPTMADAAVPYLTIANIGAMIFCYGNMVQPMMLRYSGDKSQPLVQVLYIVAFVFFCYLGVTSSGLQGFCYGVIFANIVRAVLFIAFTLYAVNQNY